MEPEQRAKNFFPKVMGPIVAAHVKQFVAGDRGLEAGLQRCETVWEEHNRGHKAKGDRRIHLGGKAELCTSSHENAHGLENRGRFRRRSDWRRRRSLTRPSAKTARRKAMPTRITMSRIGAIV